jgi:hypothetical protein
MRKLKELLYKERTYLDALFQEDPLWEDLYEGLYLDLVDKLHKDVTEYSAIERLNEVYFLCIRVLIDPHPENSFKYKFLLHGLPIQKEENELEITLAYAILYLSEHAKEKNVSRFLNKVEKHFGNFHYLFSHVVNFLAKADIYDFRIEITPKSPGELEYDYGPEIYSFWESAMDGDFTEYNIRKMLSFYKMQEDKLQVLRQIGGTMSWAGICQTEDHQGYMAVYNELLAQQTDDNQIPLKQNEEYLKNLPNEMCEALMITIQNRNAEIAQLNSELDTLKAKYLKEAEERTKRENEIEKIKIAERHDAVRELVEHLIIYAERENMNVAREIKIALKEKMANGYIPAKALRPEWQERLDSLGRNNQPTIYNTNYNYLPGATHQDLRRVLNVGRKDYVDGIIDEDL